MTPLDILLDPTVPAANRSDLDAGYKYAIHEPEPKTLSELLQNFCESPSKNLVRILDFGSVFLGCERLSYCSVAEEVSGPEDPQPMRIPVENDSKILTLWGLQTQPNRENLSIFVSLLAQQESKLRDRLRAQSLEGYTHTLFSACPDGVVVTDDFGFILKANRAMVAITRIPEENLIGKRVSQLSDSKGRSEAFKALRRLREHHRARFDCRIKVGAQKNIPVSISFRDFEFQGRSLILATVRDLSELENEVTLCTSYEQSLARSIDNATDGYVRYDQFGRITEANPYIENLTGVFANRLVGRPIDDLLTVSSLRNFRKAVAAVNETGYCSFGCAINHADGSEIPVHATLMQFELEGERYCRLMLQEQRQLDLASRPWRS